MKSLYKYSLTIALCSAPLAIYAARSTPLASSLRSYVSVLSKLSSLPKIRNEIVIGTSLQSHLALDNQGSFQFGDGKDALKQDIVSHFQADIFETVIADDGIKKTSYIVLSGIHFDAQINGQMAEDFSDRVKQDLQKPALITRNQSGLILELKAESSLEAYSRDMLYAAMKATQYQMPEGDLKASWTSSEEDGSGQYQAQYQVEDQMSAKISLHRERQFYSKLNASVEGSSSQQSLEANPHGQVLMIFDLESGLMQSIKGEEQLTYIDENRQKIGLNKQVVDWSLKTATRVSGDKIAELLQLSNLQLASNKSYDELREEAFIEQTKAMFTQRLGSDGMDDILAAFDALAGDQKEKGLTDLLLKARALVYLHPEQMKALVDHLVTLPVKSAKFETMLDALLGISSPEAQEALVELSNRLKDDPEAMQMLIPSLGFVKEPLPLVEETLRRLKSDENADNRNMASLAFGILGSQMAREKDNADFQERYRKLSHDIMEEAESKTTEEDRGHQLDVLGNLANDDSVPFIETFLKDKDTKIRSTAAMALRQIETVQANTILRSLLRSDSDAGVRVSAAEALSYAKPSEDLLNIQADAIKNEADHRVRIQLLQNISKAKFIDQGRMIAVLEQSSQSDQHEQVRAYAANLLLEFKTH